MNKSIKDELRAVIPGKSQLRHGDFIQTIARNLENGTRASRAYQDTKQVKGEKEAVDESRAEKIRLLKKAAKDPFFQQDVAQVESDLGKVDREHL